jgi:hypothetical protein
VGGGQIGRCLASTSTATRKAVTSLPSHRRAAWPVAWSGCCIRVARIVESRARSLPVARRAQSMQDGSLNTTVDRRVRRMVWPTTWVATGMPGARSWSNVPNAHPGRVQPGLRGGVGEGAAVAPDDRQDTATCGVVGHVLKQGITSAEDGTVPPVARTGFSRPHHETPRVTASLMLRPGPSSPARLLR